MFTDGKIWMAQGDDPLLSAAQPGESPWPHLRRKRHRQNGDLESHDRGLLEVGVPCFLSDLYDTLPEVGDLDKLKLVRSKGVGVHFITQSPGDIPDEVLAQGEAWGKWAPRRDPSRPRTVEEFQAVRAGDPAASQGAAAPSPFRQQGDKPA